MLCGLTTTVRPSGSCPGARLESPIQHHFIYSRNLTQSTTTTALAAGLRPIVCIGETLAEREVGKTLEVVGRQLAAFEAIIAKEPGVAAIAYEPVWAIGTGKVTSTEQAQEVHAAIRAQLTKVSAPLANVPRVLYGGSVKPDNAEALLGCADIDGALVGGASLKASDFLGIAAAAR